MLAGWDNGVTSLPAARSGLRHCPPPPRLVMTTLRHDLRAELSGKPAHRLHARVTLRT